MRNRLLLVVLAVLCVLVSSRPAPSSSRALTIEDRIEAQRSIEEVYWSHRIWPAENRSPKPPLSAVMSDAALRSRVEDYLRKSNALAAVWGRPITSEQLQAEMERMARDTQASEVLSELFAALGNDPVLIAETLVRQKLVDRRLRDAYAYDERFHGRVKRSAEGALARTATASWPKSSFDVWWSKERNTLGASLAEGVGTHAAVQPRGTACVDDTWRTTFDADIPDGRAFHTAVWTGTEMIVWGGFVGGTPESTGGRYDPSTDTWAPTSTGAGVPQGRGGHTAVWTGTRMIVWGGSEIEPYNPGSTMNTGGLYDPSTDSWVPTSTGASVPQGRANHTAVWTGSRMIVWGGTDEFTLNTGGRYDPSTNTWASTSTGAGVPEARDSHTAVWTGTEMIVWGGVSFPTFLNSGGRYNPSTNTWTATSTGASVPAGRAYHTAVWTGTEMIVWGGLDPGVTDSNTGGRYNPLTNTWAATSTGAGVPEARDSHRAVWTGSRMIVWGGFGETPLNTGGRYDPSTNTWASTSIGAGVPSGRYIHTAVWTGTEMIVWGGRSSFTDVNSGGRYDPSTDTWAATSMATSVPAGRAYDTAVWTGVEMIVWGGYDGQDLNTGGRYDPATDTWAATSTGSGVPPGRSSHTAVWTGTEMIVWGGYRNGHQNPSQFLSTGGRYDPTLDTWTATSTGAGVPSDRAYHTAVWTGTEMIVWGGGDEDCCNFLPTNTGGRYDPSTDTWAAMSTGGISPRGYHTAVWTGTEMIVWGGANALNYLNTGGRYDPSTNTWTATSTGAGVPSDRGVHTAVWTGAEMIVWGGDGASGDRLNSGGRYDPVTDTWAETSTAAGVPSPRSYHTAVWTGTEMIVWGGVVENTGGRYDPSTDTWAETSTGAFVPSPRYAHSAVWTGTEMIVWGGDPISSRGGRYCASVSCIDLPTICDDGDACTSDVCDVGTGQCVSTPIACAAPDPCHQAGVCQPGSGICTYANQPDGTTCDDGDPNTTADACQAGTCIGGASCDTAPKPKPYGYYKKLCRDGHSHPNTHEDVLTDADAACVASLTDTFAGVSTVEDLCAVLESTGGSGDGYDSKECVKGEQELMTTALNVCRQRICLAQEIDSHCTQGPHILTTVQDSLDATDDILSDPGRNKNVCSDARCLAKEANDGHGIHHTSLLLKKEAGNKVRLTWASPVMEDGSGAATAYTIWRREILSPMPFTQIGATDSSTLTCADATAGNWEYEVTFTIEP